MHAAVKRGREDGHLTRDTYDFADAHNVGKYVTGGKFSRADCETMKSRKVLSTRQQEYDRHIQALNESFLQSVKDHLVFDPEKSWKDNMMEYLAHVRYIESRFGEAKGSVLTFGSGDCGQLAHGVERQGDMAVKFPREVKGLNTHHITRLSCGGIHTAALTSVGQVFTWGCTYSRIFSILV